METTQQKIETFEKLWGTYIEKLARLDDLRTQGRYGYQLRMPKKSLGMAGEALRTWCQANGVESPV